MHLGQHEEEGAVGGGCSWRAGATCFACSTRGCVPSSMPPAGDCRLIAELACGLSQGDLVEVQVLKQNRGDKVEVTGITLHRGFCRCGLATFISAADHSNTRLSTACKLPNKPNFAQASLTHQKSCKVSC